jgi:hypothetical protein
MMMDEVRTERAGDHPDLPVVTNQLGLPPPPYSLNPDEDPSDQVE